MQVVLSPTAQRDLRRLSSEVSSRVLSALRRLRDDPRPRGALMLHDYEPPTWRLRVGAWRVLYEIDDHAEVVRVVGVRHRSKAY